MANFRTVNFVSLLKDHHQQFILFSTGCFLYWYFCFNLLHFNHSLTVMNLLSFCFFYFHFTDNFVRILCYHFWIHQIFYLFFLLLFILLFFWSLLVWHLDYCIKVVFLQNNQQSHQLVQTHLCFSFQKQLNS
jgi:hypothetical protein